MAEQLSSPSASSTLGSGSTPSKGSNDECWLRIQKQPPAYVFSGETFEIDFCVETAPPGKNIPTTEIEVIPTLEPAGKPSKEGELFLLEGSTCCVSSAAPTGKMKCKIQCEPAVHQSSSFNVRLAPKDDCAIAPIKTTTVCLVNAKIRVYTTTDWDDVWYKDEGGRDKSIEVACEVYDRANQVRREKIPLKLTLCYSAPIPVNVMNQDILKIQGSERRPCTDKSTGKARIRFRIEDVSKNHQGQDFVVKIAADRKDSRDIAPGFTPAVSVRSKRNKRQRTSGSGSGGYPERSSASPPSMIRSMGPYGDQSVSLFEGMDTVRLRSALQGVMNWTDEVVNGLYSLQWQVLGYAQHPDGTPDYTRPYHSMPNPNPLISQVLSHYTDSTRGDLRVLQQAIDQSAHHPDSSHYSSTVPMMAASMPRDSEGMFPMMTQQGTDARGMVPPVRDMRESRPLGRHPVQTYRDFPPSLQHAATAYFPMTRPEMEQMAVSSHASLPPDTQHTDSKVESDSRETEVEYVLAKQYKSMRTSERLGMPAYSAAKELLGFYRESSTKVGVSRFVSIDQLSDEFGPMEIMQATEILEEALATKSKVVHALKDWGSINNLIDHALVYDWKSDISHSGKTDDQGGQSPSRG